MNITVYLGANKGNDNKFKEAIVELGSFLYNLDGYYDSLKELLNTMISYGFSSENRQKGIYFASNILDIKNILL